MKRRRPFRLLLVALSVLVALLLAYPLGTSASSSPPEPLKAVWERAREAGGYEFTADVEQTLIPRPLPSTIGETDDRVDLRLEGEVTPPDQARIELRFEGSALDETPIVLLRDGADTYVLEDGKRVPVANPTDLSMPTADYLGYLVAAENVTVCAEASAQEGSDGSRTCYAYDVSGPRFAEYVRQQMEEELRARNDPLPPGVELSPSSMLQGMAGRGRVWVDAGGLPRREVLDLDIPRVSDEHDAQLHMVVDFHFSADARARATATNQTSEVSKNLRGLLVHDLRSLNTDVAPLDLACVLYLLTVAAVVLLSRRRRWLHALIAIGISVILATSPLLQATGIVRWQTRQAQAAPASTIGDALGLSVDRAESRPRSAHNPKQNLSPNHVSPLAVEESDLAQESHPNFVCGEGSTTEDADGDGLSDADEYCLGTDAQYHDSDRDLITDTVEVEGFTYGGHHWTSDPFLPDSNQDGLADVSEWPEPVGQAPHLADAPNDWDPDEDGIPNLWDDDNDGDGVPDDLDLSPYAFTSYSDTFALATQGSGFDGYQYIEIQIQPEITSHLRYSTGTLDWPHDELGQTKDLDDSTDDIRFTPMLRVRANQAPDPDLADDFNVLVEEEDAGYTLYMGLSPVGDGGQMVAFYTKLVYGPDELADIRWETVELVWIVELRNDEDAGDGIQTELTPLGVYPDPFRVSGLLITKSGSFEGAIIGTPEAPQEDRHLFNLVFGLSNTFLTHQEPALQAGPGEDSIKTRFTSPNTPIEQTWGVTSTLIAMDLPAEPYGFLDEAMDDLPERVQNFLDFHGYPTDGNPSLIFAMEEEVGLYGLDDGGLLKTGPSFNLNLAHVPVATTRSLKTTTYQHEGGAWRPLQVDETLHVMEERYEGDSGSFADVLDALQEGGDYPDLHENDLRALIRMFYASWTIGQSRVILVDGTPLAPSVREDAEVYALLQSAHDALPAYLLDASDLGEPDGGLNIGDNLSQEWEYLREQGYAGNELGVVSYAGSLTEPFIDLDGDDFDTWFTRSEKTIYALIKVRGLLEAAKFVKVSKFVGRLAWGLTFLDLALIWGGFVLTFWSSGWDWDSPVTKASFASAAVWTAIIAVLIIISYIPIIGTLFKLLTLVDILVYFITGGEFSVLGWIAGKLADFFYNVEQLTKLREFDFVELATEVLDEEIGLVDGNRLRITADFVGVLAGVGYAEREDLEDSWATAFWKGSAEGTTSANVNGTRDCQMDADWRWTKTCRDPVGVEFRLDVPKRNRALEVEYSVGAKTYYQECVGTRSSGRSCDRKHQYTNLPDDLDDGDQWEPMTFYVDVLPSNPFDLWTWGDIINPDPDGDGLSTAEEASLGTHRNQWDTDGDGLSDGFEYETHESLGAEPTVADTDGDGLPDGLEYRIHTSIDAADTDDDGLLDGEEYFHQEAEDWVGGWEVTLPNGTALVFSNPRAANADGDRLKDSSERNEEASPYAYNDAPHLTLKARPSAQSPVGAAGVYVEPGDEVILELGLDNTGPRHVTSTLTLCLPDFLNDLDYEPQMSGDRQPLTQLTGSCNGLLWSFASPDDLEEGWAVSTTITATVKSTLAASASGRISATLPYRLDDADGDVVDQVTVIADLDDPEATIVAPADGALLGGGISNYVIGGASDDESSWVTLVEVNLPGEGWVKAEGISPWAHTWDLPPDGQYQLQARATDYLKRTALSPMATVTVDNTPPTVTLDLEDGQILTGEVARVITVTLDGTAADALSGLERVQISVDDRPWREVWAEGGAPPAANWTYGWTLPNEELAQGQHIVAVRASDQAGNWSGPLRRTVIVDVVPPTSELTDRTYLSASPPHVPRDEPLDLYGVANDAGRVPEPSRPVELVGELDGLDDATIWMELSSVTDDDDGISVAWLGDFNGDRLADLVVGLPAAWDGAGEITIVNGRVGGWAVPTDAELLADSATSFVGRDGAAIGETLAPAGDINGDGYADLLVGDVESDRVYVVFGRPSALGRDLELSGANYPYWSVIDLTGLGDLSGLGSAGDVNGDGFDDLLIGARDAEDHVYLLLGQVNPWLETIPLDVKAAAKITVDPLGAALTGVGDMDGDENDEFLVSEGSTIYLLEGRAAYAPGSGVPNETLTLAEEAIDSFASSSDPTDVAALGDVNGDGLADFVYADGDQPRVVLGDADRNWPTQALGLFAPAPSGFLAAPGDVDADGLNDLLVGNAAGDVYLVLGEDLASVEATLTDVRAAASAPYASGADLNSDGSSDLLLVPGALGVGVVAALDYGNPVHVDPDDLPRVRAPADADGDAHTPLRWQQLGAAGVRIQATTLTVDDDGGADYLSIQAAVDAAEAGDTISVRPGAYASFAVNGKSDLTISGVHADAVFIDGGGGPFAIKVQNATGVTLRNLTLRDADEALVLDRAGEGGYKEPEKKTALDHALIYDFTSHAVSMDRFSSLRLTRCTLAGGDDHIHLSGTPDPAMDAAWSTLSTDGRTATTVEGGFFGDDEKIYFVDDTGLIDVYSPQAAAWSSLPEPPAGRHAAVTADEDGHLWALRRDPTSGFDGPIYAILYVSADEIYVGGDFRHVGGTYTPYVARWNGTQWKAVLPEVLAPDGPVYALLVDGNGLYAGGSFGLRFLPGGVTPHWQDWGNIAGDGAVRAIAFHDDGMFVGGDFDDIGTVAAHKIAKRESDGTWMRVADPPSNACNGILSAGRHVSALENQGGIVYLAGRFQEVGAQASGSSCRDPAVYGMAKTNGTAAYDYWVSGFPRKSDLRRGSDVYDIAFYGDDMVVGGDIDNVVCYYEDGYYEGWWPDGSWCSSSGSASNLAIFADKYWHLPGYLKANEPVRTLQVAGDDLHIGGEFTQVGGDTPAQHVAYYSGFPDGGGTWHTLDDGVNGTVYALAHHDGHTYIGGSFTMAGDRAAFRFAHWDGTQWLGLSEQAFYEYDGDAWRSRAVLPDFVGDGASIVSDGDGHLYAAPGSGSTELYRYSIATDTWESRSSIPGGLDTGGGLAWTDEGLFALRGGDTRDLYRYDPGEDRWDVRASIPLTGPVVGVGGGLAWDDRDWLYVLAGGNGVDFLRYHIGGDQWEMLQEAEQVVNLGGGVARVGQTVYGVPGGDQALWSYDPIAIYPEKLTLENVAFVVPEASSDASWINRDDLVVFPDDFLVGGAGNAWVGGSTLAWSPEPILGDSDQLTHDEARLLDPERDVYRADTGTLLDAGYHAYRPGAVVGSGEEFATIQGAVNSGANRVLIRPGVYQEPFYLISGVTVAGNGADLTVLASPASPPTEALVRAEGVVGAELAMLTMDGDASGADGLLAEDGAQYVTLERTIIRGTDAAISVTGDAAVEVVNNTLVSNTAGLVAANCAPVDVRNTIFASHSGTGLAYEGCATRKLHKHNLYWDNYDDLSPGDPGPGELFLDPLFVAPGPPSHDYHTEDDSPVIEAGDPGDPPPPGGGGRVDIGYIEQNRASLYVDDDYCATCENDGLSWQVDAFDVIQDALDTADTNLRDLKGVAYTVGVGPGTYTETISIPSHVRLTSSGAEDTILDARSIEDNVVTIDGVVRAEITGFTIRAFTNTTAISVTGASNAVTITRNVIETWNETSTESAVAFSGRATGVVVFNTLVSHAGYRPYSTPTDERDSGISSSGPGTWVAVENNIFTGLLQSRQSPGCDHFYQGHFYGLRTDKDGQVFNRHNLLWTRVPYDDAAGTGLTEGPGDLDGASPCLEYGTYRPEPGSEARDAAAPDAEVPPGGGERADLGYYELSATPASVFLGREDVSSATGNSGVSQVEVGLSRVSDPASAVSETLPGGTDWTTATLEKPGETVSYWQTSYTPTQDSLYRFYSRATDVATNREEDEADWYDGAFVSDSTAPVVTWTLPTPGAVVSSPLQLKAQVCDYADGAFSVDDIYFSIGGDRIPAEWAADPWDEEAQEPRSFRAWLPLSTGVYTEALAAAVDRAGNQASDTLSFTVSGSTASDTIAPTLVVSSPVNAGWFSRTVVFSGTVTDNVGGTGVAAVEVSVDGGFTWDSATVDGDDWALTWEAPDDVEFMSYPAWVRARDQAHNTIQEPRTFSIDNVPPNGPHAESFVALAGFGRKDAPPGSHFDFPVDLEITWRRPWDGSGVAETLLAVDQAEDTVPTVSLGTVATTTQRSLSSEGDWYVHLAVRDQVGNQSVRHYGPWHVGSFADTTQSFFERVQTIVIDGQIDPDRIAGETSEILREWGIYDLMGAFLGSGAMPTWRGPQRSYVTWAGSDLYFGWSGAWWELDGDLWIYLNVSTEGCTAPVYPVSSCPELPFASDYAINITSPVTGTLWQCEGSNPIMPWQPLPGIVDWEFAQGDGGDTEIRVNWQDLLSGPGLPDALNLGMIAFALDDDADPWAVFPDSNSLQGSCLCQEAYTWSNIMNVFEPNAGQPQGAQVQLSIDSPQALRGNWCPGSTLEYVITVENVGEEPPEPGSSVLLHVSAGAGLGFSSLDGAADCDECPPQGDWWVLDVHPIDPGASSNITLTGVLTDDLNGISHVDVSVKVRDLEDPLPLPDPGPCDVQASISHLVDGQPPTVSVTTDPAKTIRPILGTACDDGGGVTLVEYQLDGGGWQPADGTLFWSVDLELPAVKTWRLDLQAWDRCGSSQMTSVQFTDATPPTLTVDMPPVVSLGPVDIVGTVEDIPSGGEVVTAEVQVDDGSWQLATLGPPDSSGIQVWDVVWEPSASGVTYTVRARGTDLADNVGQSEPHNVYVSTLPIADAGADQTVGQGEDVTLDGSASHHPDGDPIAYGWTQVGGPDVTLSDNGAVSPTFTAPALTGPITFTLTVTDSWGMSDADMTVVTVGNPDLALEKDVSDQTPRSGERIAYAITVSNNSPGDVAGVVISDELPSGVTYVAEDSGGYDAGSGAWNVGGLGGGATRSLHITATVDAVAPGTLITNTAVISTSGRSDADPANDVTHAVIAAQHPDAVIITVTPEASGTAVYVDGGVLSTTVKVPMGAVSETITIILTPLAGPTHPTDPWAFAGHAFKLEAYQGPYLLPGYVFQEPISVTVHYSDEDLNRIADEATLMIATWTEGGWQDAACPGSNRQLEENWLSADICHASEFVLLGQGEAIPVGGVTLDAVRPAPLWLRVVLVVLAVTAQLAAAAVLTRLREGA